MNYEKTKIILLPPLLWSVLLLLWSVPKKIYNKYLVYIRLINKTNNISDLPYW